MKRIYPLLFMLAMLAASTRLYAQFPTNGDCLGAIPLCQSVYTFNSSANGPGNYTDLPVLGAANENHCPTNCISAGEANTTWYVFTTQSGGLVNFTLTPNDPADDYDWAVYNITTGGCSGIYAGGMQVSCNYCLNTGSTGPNGGGTYWCEGPNGCNQYNAPIPVSAGQTYALMVGNFSGSFNGYSLNFGASTASIVDNSPPQVVSLVTPILCGASQLQISFSENINCSSISPSDFSISGPGGPYTISYIAGPNCLNGGTMEHSFTLTVIPDLTTGGSFNLNLAANSVSDVCGNLNAATSMPFTITAPNVSITPSAPSYCGSGSVNLTASGAGSFTWSPATGLNTTTGPNVTANPSVTTVYTVMGVTQGCTDVEGVQVTVNPIPSVSIAQNPAGAQCAGTPVTLTASSSVGGTNYTWSGGAGTGASVVVTPASTTTYTVTGTAATCTGTSAITVTINPLPNVTLSAYSNVCINGGMVTLNNGNPAGGTYSGTGVSGNTFDPSLAGLGTHTITYTYTNVNSCTNSAQQPITVLNAPDASINASGPYCISEPAVTLTAVTSGGTWSGTGITDANAGTFDPAVAGLGSHTITYITPGPCPDTSSLSFSVVDQADASITASGPYCNGGTAVNLSAADPGGTWSGNGITDANAGTFDPSVAGVGIHTIIYAIGGNCADADTASIEVLYQPQAVISAAGPYCSSDPAVNLSVNEPGGSWSGTGITSSVNGTFNPATAGAGTHVITYIIAGNCPDTATLSITVNDQMDATITPAGPFCSNDPALNLTAADAGGSWSGNGITSAANGTFNPGTAGAGDHVISYTISGSCGDVDSVTLSVFPVPVLGMSGTAETCMGAANGTVITSISSGTPPYTVLWNNMATTPQLSGLAPGTYTVVVTDDEGCVSSAFYEVDSSFVACEVIVPVIFVPNIFSPNGDLVNDILYVHGQGVLEINFSIYNRWGEEMFNTKDLATGWDGTFNGKPVDPAVFVWHIKATFANGEFVEKTGNVTLTR